MTLTLARHCGDDFVSSRHCAVSVEMTAFYSVSWGLVGVDICVLSSVPFDYGI